MPTTFRPYQPDQLLLLSPDLRERLAGVEGHIEQLDGRMGHIEGRMGRLEGLEKRVAGIEDRTEPADGRGAPVEGRIGDPVAARTPPAPEPPS